MQYITILGSTGSIGSSVLAVVKNHPECYRIYALVSNKNVSKMFAQCLEFKPRYVAMADKRAASRLRSCLKEHRLDIDVQSGADAICDIASMTEVDQVVAAIVGIAGLLPTIAAIKRGKRVLLANKESLVAGGNLFMQAVKKYNAQLLPIDSEHNAMFQCMPKSIHKHLGFANLADYGVEKLVLTGSGGPFRNKSLSSLRMVSVSETIEHPNWSMGKKISVDSATMMNKGLEYIEARWLFNASAEQVKIIIHPQSVIHSMVSYRDGSVLAQLSYPDMSVSIAYALGYPKRIESGVKLLDFCKLTELTFYEPDFIRYPCLKLAILAFDHGRAATTILNAVNEVAVDAFLNKRIGFLTISDFIEAVLTDYMPPEPTSIEEVLDIDETARHKARETLKKFEPYYCN